MPDVSRLAYDAAWHAVMPFLALSSRLREGYAQRLVPVDWAAPPVNLWLQAASGGEAYLAWELLKALPEGAAGTVLVSSCTSQGVGVVERAAAWARDHRPGLLVRPTYFPFDAPRLMARALDRARPTALVLLETELWPGLLLEAKRRCIPILVVNGRMTTRSFARYLGLAGWLRRGAPDHVLAIAEADARRFATLFPSAQVAVAGNIKFDRFDEGGVAFPDNPLHRLFKRGTSFAVLGSVRQAEEPEVLCLLERLRQDRPKTVIGLFPRHMQRVAQWADTLGARDIPWVLRSSLDPGAENAVAPGTVILWDVFGELGLAYGLCRAAFVGGSLKPLGGQNFLEPLAQGIVPVIGPHWDNFAWVGREAVDEGLVREAADASEAAELMVKFLKRPTPPAKVLTKAEAYFAARGGAARRAAALMADVGGLGGSGATGDRKLLGAAS